MDVIQLWPQHCSLPSVRAVSQSFEDRAATAGSRRGSRRGLGRQSRRVVNPLHRLWLCDVNVGNL